MKNNKTLIRKSVDNTEDQNLGLDADHSSESNLLVTRWNNDNDRISGNPEGESDDSDHNTRPVNSPLDDK